MTFGTSNTIWISNNFHWVLSPPANVQTPVNEWTKMNTQICRCISNLVWILRSIEKLQKFIFVLWWFLLFYLPSSTMRHPCLCKFCHFSFQTTGKKEQKCSHRKDTALFPLILECLLFSGSTDSPAISCDWLWEEVPKVFSSDLSFEKTTLNLPKALTFPKLVKNLC